jgi:hypothetical protein
VDAEGCPWGCPLLGFSGKIYNSPETRVNNPFSIILNVPPLIIKTASSF